MGALLDAIKAQATPLTVDILDLPCAAGLIEQSRALSIATGEPPLMSLRRIVDDFSGAAAIARQHLAEEVI